MPFLLLKAELLMTKELYETFAEMPSFIRDLGPSLSPPPPRIWGTQGHIQRKGEANSPSSSK